MLLCSVFLLVLKERYEWESEGGEREREREWERDGERGSVEKRERTLIFWRSTCICMSVIFPHWTYVAPYMYMYMYLYLPLHHMYIFVPNPRYVCVCVCVPCSVKVHSSRKWNHDTIHINNTSSFCLSIHSFELDPLLNLPFLALTYVHVYVHWQEYSPVLCIDLTIAAAFWFNYPRNTRRGYCISFLSLYFSWELQESARERERGRVREGILPEWWNSYTMWHCLPSLASQLLHVPLQSPGKNLSQTFVMSICQMLPYEPNMVLRYCKSLPLSPAPPHTCASSSSVILSPLPLYLTLFVNMSVVYGMTMYRMGNQWGHRGWLKLCMQYARMQCGSRTE